MYIFLISAVRFGRVPKREKARIMAAMQNVQHKTLEKSILMDLEDESKATSMIIDAYLSTCEYTLDNIRRQRNVASAQPMHTYDPDYPVSINFRIT